jgi:hypothetical protein
MFFSMRSKLTAFFMVADQHRKKGPTVAQKAFELKTGINFSYKIKMHNCLKRLLRECVITKPANRQIQNLVRVFAWFQSKLESMGGLDLTEGSAADEMLNPDKIRDQK